MSAISAVSFLFGVAFIPGILNAGTAGRWAILALVFALAVIHGRVTTWTSGHIFGALLIAWSALSCLWSPDGWYALDALAKMVLLAAVFCIGAQLPSLRPVYLGLGLALAVNGVVAVAQVMGWTGIAQISIAPGGLFGNKNYLAEAAGLVLLALLGERLWWLAVAVLPALILPGARGALLGVGVGALMLWPRARYAGLLMLLAAFAAAIVATMLGQSPGVAARIAIWRDAIDGLTFRGHGLGSFYTTFPDVAARADLALSRPEHAHNDLLELAYETGAVGVVLAVAFLVAALLGTQTSVRSLRKDEGETERAVLVAVLVMACFAFPFHLPVTAALGLLVAGRLCGARASLCRHVADRGMALQPGGPCAIGGNVVALPSPRRCGVPARSPVPRGAGEPAARTR